MAEHFLYDVFLLHSRQDQAIIKDIAQQLQAGGLRVWLEEWEGIHDNSMWPQAETALQQSRILVLCLSGHLSALDWAWWEYHTLPFRDPLNEERRFIPLRLDDSSGPDSLSQYSQLHWDLTGHAQIQLLNACKLIVPEVITSISAFKKHVFSVGHSMRVNAVVFSPDSQQAVSGSEDCSVRIWNANTGECLHTLAAHEKPVNSVAWSSDGQLILSAGDDHTIRVWEVETGNCRNILQGHTSVKKVTLHPKHQQVAALFEDDSIKVWNYNTGICTCTIEAAIDKTIDLIWNKGGNFLITGAEYAVGIWDVHLQKYVRIINGWNDLGRLLAIALSPDDKYVLAGSVSFVHQLNIYTGQRESVLLDEKKISHISSIAWSPNGNSIVYGTYNAKMLVQNGLTQESINLEKLTHIPYSIDWSRDSKKIIAGLHNSEINIWDTSSFNCQIRIRSFHDVPDDLVWSTDKKYFFHTDHSLIKMREVGSGNVTQIFGGNFMSRITGFAVDPTGNYLLAASQDKWIRLYDTHTGKQVKTMTGRRYNVRAMDWSHRGQFVLCGDETLALWDVASGQCQRVFDRVPGLIWCLAWSPDDKYVLTGSNDSSVSLWEIETGKCLQIMKGHSGCIQSVSWSPDGKTALTASIDGTLRIWEVATGKCLRIMEGHTNDVQRAVWSPDAKYIISGSIDGTIRLWKVSNGRCIQILKGDAGSVAGIEWSNDGKIAYSVFEKGIEIVWDLSLVIQQQQNTRNGNPEQVQYTNAKVLLVGDSGVGKTGLSNYLAHNIADTGTNTSTDGAWATQWRIPHSFDQDGVDREIWLWDFAGQIDYRLMHQLFMDETAAAVFVFNPQQENPFDGLGQWERDVRRSYDKPFAKLLVAGRIDRGSRVVSETHFHEFMKERGFIFPFHETSAKTGKGCNDLRDAIVKAIDWQAIAITTSPVLYYRLKQEILNLREKGMVLIRLAELKQRMELALPDELITPEELKAVIGLLDGPGIIQWLPWGNIILLKPEVLSQYAAAVVRKVRQHSKELGCISVKDLLAGKLDYQDFIRLPREDEALLLNALYQKIIARAWCLEQSVDGDELLVFPSYFLRSRPIQPEHPEVLVSYRFIGPIDQIYATLIVRLHYTQAFESKDLWKDAADFLTQTGQRLGIKLVREPEGVARIDVYFNNQVVEDMRLVFAEYVHRHLSRYDTHVIRLRHYHCTNKDCEDYHKPINDQGKIDRELAKDKGKLYCSSCGKPIRLLDVMEQKIRSQAIQEKAQAEDVCSQIKLNNKSREMLLVGNVMSLIAESGQHFMPYPADNVAIDGHLEFRDHNNDLTGRRFYLQLKSGDSYLRTRKRDGAEIFTIKNKNWINEWLKQDGPVFLVVRNSNGVMRWMEIRTYLRVARVNGTEEVNSIIFQGEPFTVASILKYREKVLMNKFN